jgi:FlaA1/EpsC-like NDP-sugar epimerase
VAAAESGYRMIGFVDEDASTHGTHILGYRVLGGYDRLTTMIVRHDVDTVIVSSRLMDALRLAGVQQLCAAHGVKLFRFHIELQTLAEGGPGAAHESTAEPRARAQ